MIDPPETRYARNGAVHLAYQVLGEGPVIVGRLAGCAPALVFTAAHPERAESLILMGGYARLSAGEGYAQGAERGQVDQIAEAILGTWGTGADLDLTNPSTAGDDNFRRWWAQMQRMAASPATAAAMARQWFEVDVRSVLPAIRVPALVIARAANALFPAHHTRYLADHIAGAKYIEFPGADLDYFLGNAGPVLDAIEEFVTGTPPMPDPDRFLGNVLFADVAGSTQLAAQVGDSRFRDLLASRGTHQLKGVPGLWEIFAVTS